jgi:hypothetical protein
MRTKKLIIPPIKVIASMIDTPHLNLDRWKGNCYCVASKIVDNDVLMTECRAVYGHYLGPVSSKSYFSNRKGMPFISHGWILLPNGDIIDPTRWVFEAKEPYMAFIDHMDDVAEEYDEGGNQFRAAWVSPPPEYSKGDRQVSFTEEEFDKIDGRTYVLGLLGDKRKNIKSLCLDQIFWLANLSLDTLGVYVREIYAYIQHIEQDAFIPFDNRVKILGKD